MSEARNYVSPLPGAEGAGQPPHVLRMIDEANQLIDRTEKLVRFLKAPAFFTLAVDDAELLSIQHNLMCSYAAVLRARLRRCRLDLDCSSIH